MGEAYCAALRPIRLVMGYAVILAIVFSPYGIQAKDTVSLSVTVSGLRSESGTVHIALYDEPKNFPNPNGMIRKAEVPIVAGIARYDFFALKKRRYAIAIYHDENDNDSFDRGFLGIPLEDYAFSNNATVSLGPPSFDDAAFILSAPTRLNIRIHH